ncbi:hypothetical protein ACRB8A_19395 (plasmid) [Arthrobacter sp. G.S.26]|uniref:hypothetical protein n=1 Tax=Arthrobacter sp. G.S.26 TaxID=3433706 RepID=UPI003D78303E
MIISVGSFVAALVASVTPLLLAAGPSILDGILATRAFVGCAWAWLVFHTRDAPDAFADDAQLEGDHQGSAILQIGVFA